MKQLNRLDKSCADAQTTREERMNTYERLKERALGFRANADDRLFAEWQRRRFKRDADDVEALLALIEAVRDWKDPFDDEKVSAALAGVMEDTK